MTRGQKSHAARRCVGKRRTGVRSLRARMGYWGARLQPPPYLIVDAPVFDVEQWNRDIEQRRRVASIPTINATPGPSPVSLWDSFFGRLKWRRKAARAANQAAPQHADSRVR